MAAPQHLSPAEQRGVQRRTLIVLSIASVFGGLAVSGAITAGGLLVVELTGSTATAGLAQTSMVLGSAALAIPLAWLSQRRGRRIGLVAGFGLGLLGAALVVLAAAAGAGALAFAGLFLFGAAMAAGLQARFAATDLADGAHVSRDLSVVMWMTAVGAVIGPNLVEPAGATAVALGLPELAGMFAWSAIGFALAVAALMIGLRPDPLLTAQASAPADTAPATGLAETIRAVRAAQRARLALIAIVCAHAAMIALMVMTPLHLDAGGATLRVVGLVISIHVLGMYLFAPVLGSLADAVGRIQVIALGAGLLVVSGILAAWAPAESSGLVAVALFLLGLGWSACVVAGSGLLVESLPLAARPGAQGLSDTLMGFAAAVAGALAGVVVGVWSFSVLGLAIAIALLPLLVLVQARWRAGEPVRG